MSSSVVEYLESKNIKYTIQGNEVIIICPACGKEKLYINQQSLVYHCFVCEAENPASDYARGHFSKLKELWGDIVDITPASCISNKLLIDDRQEANYSTIVKRYNYALLNSIKGKKYLFKRGFDESVIKKYKLGIVEMKDDLWISIPSFEEGIPKLLKYRKITNNNSETKKYEREFGSKSILFNGDALNNFTDIIITEGEYDAIMLMEQGYDNVVGVTGGAGTLLPEWYDKLRLMNKITLIFDSDQAGQNAVINTWIERLGVNKCWNILLPKGYDVNSYFLDYTLEDFKKLVPYQVKVKGIVSLNDTLMDMYSLSKSKEQILYPLPWPEINELIGGGLELQQLMVIGAQSSMGKTTMAMQIAHHYIKTYNMPCLVFCLEMTAVKLAVKFLQLEYDLTYSEIKYSDALIYLNDLVDIPIYFGYTPDITMEKLYNTIEEARNRYGIKFVVFDNLQLLVTSDKESMYASAMKMFKKIPMSLNLIMCLISQPRKLNSEESLNFDALKGSAAIAQASDHTLLIHRKRLKGVKTGSSFSDICQIINDKARFSAGGIRQLILNGA